MSKISDLIAKLCPNGVEYKKLGEVAHYSANRIDACCVNAKTYVGVESLLAEKQGKVDSACVPSAGRLIEFVTGDVLIGNIRPYLKKIWLADCDGGTNGDVLVVQINDRTVLTPEYLYYVLSSDSFFLYDMQFAKGAKMPRGDKESILGYPIPVPPIEVQREVVEALDKFALLTAELTAELEKRKKQYEHYRDKLLEFTPPLAEITIFDACEICRGRVMSKKYLRDNAGEDPVFSSQTANGGVFGCISTYDFDGEYVTWTTDGANAGSVFYHDGKFSITNVCGLLKSKRSDVLIKFVFYWLQVMAKNYVSSGMGNPKLMSNVMGRIKIPLLPLAEQERIVKILDKFDKLCNDLTSGLPAEIAARKKQYEYYRDKLLNFKRAA